MSLTSLVLMAMLAGSSYAIRSDRALFESIRQSNTSSCQSGQGINKQIKITIATGGEPYQPAKDTFHVGEAVPVVITMTNTGSEPIYVCESGTIYQDSPQLLKNGEPVTYSPYRQSMIDTAQKDKTCQNDDLPQQVLLPPNQPTVVDWFNLAPAANSLYDDGWYKPLSPGKYTLTNRRRLDSCDGPLMESNTISFTVVP